MALGSWRQMGVLFLGGGLAAVSVAAARKAVRCRGLCMAGPEAARLAALWKGAVETMVLPEGTLSLAPVASDDASRASFGERGIPAALAGGSVFALTAFDPPGVSRTREANAAQNTQLYHVLAADISPKPAAAWPAFGVDTSDGGDGWREDGFCLGWGETEAAAARAQVVKIAKSFGQGAIYEYYAVDGALRRRTVGALMKIDAAESETSMGLLDYETLARSSHIVRQPFAGPDPAALAAER